MQSVIRKIAPPLAVLIISLVWLPQATWQLQAQRQDERSRLLERVKSTGVKNISSYVQAPSGKRIVFVGEFEETWAFVSIQVARQQTDLWVVNRDGSGLRRLTSGGLSYDPAWSPDEHEIAFVRDGSVRILNLDTLRSRGLRALRAYRPQLWECDYHEFSDPKWSPNGKAIAALASNGCGLGSVIAADTRFGNELCNIEQEPAEYFWNSEGELIIKGYGKRVFDWSGSLFKRRALNAGRK
jgi:Tol biopolymer transport system component